VLFKVTLANLLLHHGEQITYRSDDDNASFALFIVVAHDTTVHE